MAERSSLITSWEDLSNDVVYREQLDKNVHQEQLNTTSEDHTVVTRNKPRQPLSGIECAQLFDDDGRLVKEVKLRKALFEGGVDDSWRRYIWKFIFEIYPFNSTYREQKTIDLENRARYKALHERWVVLDKAVHLPDEEPSSDPLEYVFSSDGEEADENDNSNNNPHFQDNSQPSKIYSFAERVSLIDSTNHTSTEQNFNSDHHMHKGHKEFIPASDFMSSESCPYCFKTRTRSCSGSYVLTDEESQSLLAILELPSKVYATRQPVDLDKSYPKGKRLILRDVKRTDRVVHYFSHKRNLRKVHRILHIYALFHPDMGYAQGMNDILARFLVVTDSEVDSYWMFCGYMEKKRADFLEDTMMCKITLVKSLMSEIDDELSRFFEISECSDYLFCHRWLLLDFKREFIFMDSLRILEVLTSNHLELSSDRAAIEQEKIVAEEFAADGGELRAVHIGMNTSFTFDIFICIAILTVYKKEVSKETDAASVYGYLNSLCMKMKVDDILAEAEKLLLGYCRQSVLKGFKEIDL